MSDQERIEGILQLIAKDEELTKAVAEAIGDTPSEMEEFLDYVEFEVTGRHNPASRKQQPLDKLNAGGKLLS